MAPKKGFACVASFTVFGKRFQFEPDDRGNGWEWCYRGNGKQPIYLNDLSSRENPSWLRYKSKLIKKLKPVTQIEAPWIDTAISSDSRVSPWATLLARDGLPIEG